MHAHSLLRVLLAVLLSSIGSAAHRVPPSATSRPHVSYGATDDQGASAQIPEAWRSLPRVPVGVSGSTNPDQIPDSLAYRHLIKATASSASATDIRRREAFLLKAGLTVADRLAFVNALGDTDGRLRETDTAIVAEAQERIRAALSADGSAKLAAHIRDYLKRRIVIYSAPPPGIAVPCQWEPVSLFVEGMYSEEQGTWTVYAQTDRAAAGDRKTPSGFGRSAIA